MSYKYVRTIFIGYLSIIFIGAILLSLPFSHIGDLRFIDAIFTSTSAACVTGLIVTSTSENFTVIGEIIILMLIQIGGIGYMSLVIIFFLFVKDNLSLDDKRATKLSLDLPDLHVGAFIKKILLVVLTVETIGALILSYQFSEKYELSEAIWYGVFNSISAFNNAGFSLFTDNMIGYKDNTIVLFTICFLIILGGLGYFVIIELHENKKFAKRITIHTKIVILGTIFLILFGMILSLSIEWNNPKTLGELSVYDKLLNSFFLSVNFRTAGFNSMDLSGLKDSSLFFSTLLMMTGAGQGGTAGGMKITTIAVLVIMVLFVLKQSNQEPHVFKRTIEQKLINKAAAIVMFSSAYVLFITLLLVETQDFPFMKILFEVVSAFCTVGVSVGDGGILSLCALFDDFGKGVVIISMIAGRLGVFAFGLLLVGEAKKVHFKYPVGRIII
jgi:trk system potassium uptake protein TrkH